MHGLQRRVTKAALRFVEDTLEGKVVVGLHDDAQVRESVPDFLTFVEPRAADDAVRNAELHETFFETAHLKRGADENGDVADLAAIARDEFDVVGDLARFFLRAARDGPPR